MTPLPRHLLRLDDLSVWFDDPARPAVDRVSLSVDAGRTLHKEQLADVIMLLGMQLGGSPPRAVLVAELVAPLFQALEVEGVPAAGCEHRALAGLERVEADRAVRHLGVPVAVGLERLRRSQALRG